MLANASEGFCSLCNRQLSPHDGVACCRCCGAIYQVKADEPRLSTCEENSRECPHLAQLWERRRTSQGYEKARHRQNLASETPVAAKCKTFNSLSGGQA